MPHAESPGGRDHCGCGEAHPSPAPTGRRRWATDEIRWQLRRTSPAVGAALRRLPAVGEDRSGPLGPGLLASGQLGAIVRDLQAGLAGLGAG